MSGGSARAELSLFRDVKAHILGNGIGPSPKITCDICRVSQIMIPGLHPDIEIESIPKDQREGCTYFLVATCLEVAASESRSRKCSEVIIQMMAI